MAYIIQNLIDDVLPRIARLKAPVPNLTIWDAANAVLSLLYKKLLDRRSDLLADGHLFLIIPEYDYYAPLPSDFLGMAEKPKAVEAPSWLMSTAWMAGTVVSYDSATKTLVLNVTATNGSGTVASWSIAIGWLPGEPIFTVDTSASSVAVGTGNKTFVTATALSLVPGQNIIISNVELPTDQSTIARLQPEYLDEDDHNDYYWWDSEYRYYSETWENASTKPRRFKVLGTNLYVRPKVTVPNLISGIYYVKPASFSALTDIIPWNGLFDEIFREGTVRIIQKGIPIPEADPDFALFIYNQMDTILNSRIHLMPDVRRMKRANWM